MNQSGILDNHKRGNVGEFLKEKIQGGSKLSFVSAYFTIYAHHALKDELGFIDHLLFLFGEPRFIQSLDPEKTDKKAFDIEDSRLQFKNRLEQRKVAKDCAGWIKEKVDVRSVKQPGFLHGKMYHINNSGVQEALLGSSNFTVGGLGRGRRQRPSVYGSSFRGVERRRCFQLRCARTAQHRLFRRNQLLRLTPSASPHTPLRLFIVIEQEGRV